MSYNYVGGSGRTQFQNNFHSTKKVSPLDNFSRSTAMALGDPLIEQEAFSAPAIEALENEFIRRVGDIGKDPELIGRLHEAYALRYQIDAGPPDEYSMGEYATEDPEVAKFYGITNNVPPFMVHPTRESYEDTINRLILDAIDDILPEALPWEKILDINKKEAWKRTGNFASAYNLRNFQDEYLRDKDPSGWHPFYGAMSTSDKKNTIDIIANRGLDDIYPRPYPSMLYDKKKGPFATKVDGDDGQMRPLEKFFMENRSLDES